MSAQAVETSGTITPKKQNPVHLPFLDGLRGLAALYVVIFHATGGQYGVYVPQDYTRALHFLRLGHFAVCVFIVLSGFCLMLPVARSLRGELSGGLKRFVQNRARRILPPYYAALAFAIPVQWMIIHRFHPEGVELRAGNILSHLLLVHNLREDWNMALDTPTWSVAVEWQIYFIFALALLPLWKKLGLAVLPIAIALGYAPHLLLPTAKNFDWCCPWFLGLFAMGMCGAVVAASEQPAAWRLRRLPWGGIALALFAPPVAYCLLTPATVFGDQFIVLDSIVGLATAAMIIAGSKAAEGGRPGWFRVLETRPMIALGGFSYSLYLIHGIILNIVDEFMYKGSAVPVTSLYVKCFVIVPLCIACAALFSLVFEKPFLRSKQGRPVAPVPPVLAAHEAVMEKPLAAKDQTVESYS